MKTQHPPLSYLPLLLNLEHDKPPAIGECTGGSLQGSDSSLPYLSPEVGETCGAGGYDGRHSSNPSISTFGKLEMQTSEACHKNFMIFDHSEDKNTVILHPSWLNSRPCQPSLEPQSAQDARDFFSELQAFNNKAVEAMCSFRSSAAPNPAPNPEGAEFPVYREAMESAVVQMQRKMVMNGFSSLSTKARCSLLEYVNAGEAPNLKKNASGISFPLDSGEELQSEFHEDTEEIDALLSSDDELSSTGHSPSDASSNCHNEHKKNHGNSIIGKKRKLQDCTVDEDDDADSGPGKPESGDTFSGASMKNLPCRANKGTTDFFDQVGDCKSGKSSGTFGEGGLVDRVKKIKIKTNVQRLKNVIPGGDGLDSAGVLSRTIQYVKSLQNRLRDLEATRELSGMKKTKLGLDGLLLNYCG